MNKASPLYRNDFADTLHMLMEKLPEKLVQDKLWKQFHTRTEPVAVDKPRKRFKKHPQLISNSGSELLSSRNPSESDLLAGEKANAIDLAKEKKQSVPSMINSENSSASDFGGGEIVTLRKDFYKNQIRQARASFDQEVAGSKSVKTNLKKKVTLTCELDSQSGLNKKKSGDSVLHNINSDNSSDFGGGEVVTLRKDFHKSQAKAKFSQQETESKSVKANLKKKVTLTCEPGNQTDVNKKKSGDSVKKTSIKKKVAAPVEDSLALKNRLSEDLRQTKKLYQTDFNEEFVDHTDLKLKHIMQKTLNCMEDIRLQIDAGYEPPDGSEDLERRKKRALEFASRFARNYLYQLNRQINEIRKLLKPTSGRISFRNCSNVLQKLVSSYQTIQQGLNAYHNHLPTTVCLGEPDKVKELLKLCFVLCDIHRNCFSKDINCNNKTHEVIDIFEVRSKHLLDKIEEAFDVKSTVSLAQSNHSKFSILTGPAKLRKTNAMKSRYSMYAVMPTRKDSNWKRAVASLAKKKFNVQSRYKTANFKHRPPMEKPVVIKLAAPKPKTLERKSSSSLKPSKYVMNDDIQTMVQIQREKEASSDYRSDKSGMLLAPLMEKVLQKLSEENKDMSQDQVKNILQGLTEMVRTCDDVNRLPKTEKDDGDELGGRQLTPPTPPGTAVGDVPPRSLATSASAIAGPEKEIKREEVNRRGKKQIITVTGARNAQLICIKDNDDSLVEPSEEKSQNEIPKPPSSEDGNRTSCECNKAQSKISLSGSEHASKVKISRLPKRNLTKLKMLPKENALNVLQYKIEFSKAKKKNPMYKKSSYIQPWKLMGIIADTLLEELLVSLGKEIQMNEIIERIYASEFM